MTLDELGDAQASPDAGELRVFARSDGLYSRNSAGSEKRFATADQLFVSPPFSHSGDLATGTGSFKFYNDSGRTLTITAVRASLGTAPTGASVILDVNINGTTIYTTQANRPTIAVSQFTVKNTTMDVTAWADGDYLTVDIDQIGSTVKGANLTVTIWAM